MESMFPVFQPASPHADFIQDLFLELLAISAGIFGLIVCLIAISLTRSWFRGDAMPKQIHGNRRAEIGWMVGPILIVIWIGVVSAKMVLTVKSFPREASPHTETSAADMTVIGHQWWWEIRYANEGPISANELHIPVDKKILLALESADVIHSFWVPQLAGKMDCIPGRTNLLWLEANRPGEYEGWCTEFCGSQHAWMKFVVIAHTQSEYERWLEQERSERRKPTEPDEKAGERVFFAATCANCHAIRGTNAKATIGPDLTNISRRQQLGAGVIDNSRENLTRWLENPQTIKPACKMPMFRFSPEQLRQLVTYLEMP